MAKIYKYSTSFMHNGKKYSVKGNTKEEIYTKKANMIRDLKENVIIYIGIDCYENRKAAFRIIPGPQTDQ